MKVIFNNETKRLPNFESYSDLTFQSSVNFGFLDTMEFGENIKFYYKDTDGDVISLTNQSDLDEAYKVMGKGNLKLVIAKNIQQALKMLAGSTDSELNMSIASPRSSISKVSGAGMFSNPSNLLEQKLQASSKISNKLFDDQKLFKPLSTERNTHTIGCGGESGFLFPMSTQSTDARDMVKDFSSTFQSNFGCNTEGILTSEKQVGARMETNEIGSQAQAQFKEVMCNTRILTESQAC